MSVLSKALGLLVLLRVDLNSCSCFNSVVTECACCNLTWSYITRFRLCIDKVGHPHLGDERFPIVPIHHE